MDQLFQEVIYSILLGQVRKSKATFDRLSEIQDLLCMPCKNFLAYQSRSKEKINPEPQTTPQQNMFLPILVKNWKIPLDIGI